MKKLYFLIIFCLIYNSAKADWELFPLNQKSYYQYTDFNYNNEKINLIAFDTIVQRVGFQSAFLNRKYRGNGIEQCYEAVTDINNYLPGSGWLNTEFDSLVYSGDTIRYSSQLYFLPQVSVGESWRIAGTLYNGVTDIEFTCTTISQQSFLGITDSVKEFTLSTYNGTTLVNSSLTGYVIKLSKNYGFLDYLSFYLLEHHLREPRLLVGLTNSIVSYGFQPPTYLDFFPYKVGDVLNWISEQHPPLSPIEQWYYHDSIISVVTTIDTLRYTSIRQSYKPVAGLYNVDTIDRVYPVYYLKSVTECPTNWLVLNSTTGASSTDISLTTSYIIESDSSISYRIIEDGFYVVSSSCQLWQVPDATQHTVFNTKQGETEYCYDAFYYNCIKLIGSYIDGVLHGDTLLETGIDNIFFNNVIGIHPNPAQNKLCITFSNYDNVKSGIEVMNLSGSVIYSDFLELSNSDCSAELDIAGFENGFYILSISELSGRSIAREKFIVQR